MEPTLHLPVPMNSRVRIPDTFLGGKATGTVVGVAMEHVIFTYIVLLDESHQAPFGEIRAIVVPGPLLTSEDGLSDWKLKK
jgi:hypothetical protein